MQDPRQNLLLAALPPADYERLRRQLIPVSLPLGSSVYEAGMPRNYPRYANTTMATAMRIAACNNVHLLEARCARWLLMMRDRVGSNQFYITHAYLAEMLGVQRAGVTKAAGGLQALGWIRYSRGHITIVDGKALTAASCSCYAALRKLDNGSKS